ncbi:hypothetical protein [Parabacteroides goldsteinii]|uniref:hypothetical protein n=1 Tax=Parabacteroides goldsteinii TaxID=328812 RepID=UPI0026775862|nr:hypothetical protein [Parabacteroides goldsteinii]
MKKGSWFIPAAFSLLLDLDWSLPPSLGGVAAGLLSGSTCTFLPTQGHSAKNQ